MYRYEVGKPYSNRTQWEEGSEYNYRSNTHEIRLFYRHPKPVEVQAVKQSEATFGLVVQEDVILLVFRFGVIPWSDASYTIHRVPEAERTLPPVLSDQERAMVAVFLIDADTGIILAIRQVSLSHEFSVKLHEAIREQADRLFDQVLFDRQLRMLYSKYDSKGLLGLAVARCKGGD